jgi:hypothetical protein
MHERAASAEDNDHSAECRRYHAPALLACGIATGKMISPAPDFAIAALGKECAAFEDCGGRVCGHRWRFF